MPLHRNKIYISYADADVRWLQQFYTALRPLERSLRVDVWDRSKIPPGAVWSEALHRAIDSAQIAVLLLSADYLASSLAMMEELPALLHARLDGARLFPVLVRPCRIRSVSSLAELQLFPDGQAQALASMRMAEAEEQLAELTRRITEVLVNTPRSSAAAPLEPRAAPSEALESAPRVGHVPTRPSLRQLLNLVLPSEGDFEAFCLEHFLDVYRRFMGTSLDRVKKTNLLLSYKDPVAVLDALRLSYPQEVKDHQQILHYESS